MECGISFSGIDGSGKTTQILKMLEFFRKNNKKCIEYWNLPKTEPLEDGITLNDYVKLLNGYDVLVLRSCYRTKEHIEYLKKVKSGEWNIETTYKLQSYFVKDTEEWFDKVIYPLMRANKTIIFDRFVYDELPYQMLFNRDVEMLRELISRLPTPHSFYLKIDTENMKKRNKDREDGKNKLFASDDRIRKLISNYNLVFSSIKCTEVDATMSSESIHNLVMKGLVLNREGDCR